MRPKRSFVPNLQLAVVAVLSVVVIATSGGRVDTLSKDSAAISATTCVPAPITFPTLHKVSNRFISVSGFPFGVALTSNGKWAFAASGPNLDVFRVQDKIPVLAREIYVGGDGAGIALSPNNRFIVIANGGSGGSVVAVDQAISLSSTPVTVHFEISGGSGAIEDAVTPDSRFAFVTLEGSSEVATFQISDSTRGGLGTHFVDMVHVPAGPVGITVSTSGRWAYVVSEENGGASGRLTVIDTQVAESGKSQSIAASVVVGCDPVRVATSNNGSLVWITLRGSDSLIAFHASDLTSRGTPQPLISVRVGSAPVGLVEVGHRNQLAVVDSNRFASSPGNVAILNFALQPQPHVTAMSFVASHYFPRDIVSSMDGKTLLVSNYGAGQIELIRLGQ